MIRRELPLLESIEPAFDDEGSWCALGLAIEAGAPSMQWRHSTAVERQDIGRSWIRVQSVPN
jgi:hypothetical protein